MDKTETNEKIIRPGGISRTVLLLSLIVVGGSGGALGYFAGGGFRSGPTVLTINGAGATFPYPFISAAATNYTITQCTTATSGGTRINYQSIGSGGGIKALIAKTVDFAASDAPLNSAQRANATASLHIPETIGSVVLAYNLPGVAKGLNFTGSLIAEIFLGHVTTWNDPSIQSLNPGVTLQSNAIQVVHRSDGSGTTFVWTSYLSLASSSWNSTVGKGTAVQWPVGLGSPGNEGVAGSIRTTLYAAGYVELAYALTNKMTYAKIRNPSGNYIEPSLASTQAAVASVTNLPSGDQSWSGVSLLNTSDPNAYPIASYTYLLVYKELNVIPGMTLNKAKALVDFLWFIVHNGQALGPPLGYAQLPSVAITVDETTIRSITFNGQTLHG
jgi:phosphate ABC transporter phosphate-binding protein